VHPDTPILRENKLYIESIIDSYVESLVSIQVLFKGHLITMDVIPDDFRTPQEGKNFGNEFFERELLNEY